jgi:hypothetical protein
LHEVLLEVNSSEPDLLLRSGLILVHDDCVFEKLQNRAFEGVSLLDKENDDLFAEELDVFKPLAEVTL